MSPHFENNSSYTPDYPLLQTSGEIKEWLENHKITRYTILPDLKVDVAQTVNLGNKNLSYIPVKFNEVNGSFFANCNMLTSLDFAPYIVDQFDVSKNQLTSLKHCPQIIKDDFYCQNNRLTSLKFCPEIIGRGFNCSHNQLKNLEFSPKLIKSDFGCAYNLLENLDFAPEIIMGTLYANNNQITELKDFAKTTQIYKGLDLGGNLLENLIGCPKEIGENFNCSDNPLKTLEGGPSVVHGEYACMNTKLTTLVYFPREVDDGFGLDDNPQLGSLQNLRFPELYQYHLAELAAHKEKSQLENQLFLLDKNKNKKPLKV